MNVSISKFLILTIFLIISVSGDRRPNRNNHDNLKAAKHHHHFHHHHHHTRSMSKSPNRDQVQMSEEPTAMISLVSDDGDNKNGGGQGGGYKLQVSGDGQLTSYLKTLENVPDSFYHNPHIITDVDEGIIPQATHVHPRRRGPPAVAATRLESSGSSNDERYYDEEVEESDGQDNQAADDNEGRYEDAESRKQVYYDDDSEGSPSNYRVKDRRERYSYAPAREAYPNVREAREYQQREPVKEYPEAAPREYVIHRDYVEKERIPKEYVVPIESSAGGDSDDGTYSGRVYGRLRDSREPVASDEYIHLPRNGDQTYVIREREVVVPSNKELIRDYLPVREASKYEDAGTTYGGDGTKYEIKYIDGDEVVPKYNVERSPKYGSYNLKELLKELNTEQQRGGRQYEDESEDASGYGTYRDAGSIYGQARYNVPKNDYMDSDDGNNGNEEYESLLSSAAGSSASAIKEQQLSSLIEKQQQQLSEQIANQQIQLQKQQQLMQKELIKEKIKLQEKLIREAVVAEEKQKQSAAASSQAEKDSEQKIRSSSSKEPSIGEIKVEVKKDKDGKKKIVTSKSTVPINSKQKNGSPIQKKDSDLKTLRTVLAKLIKQVEDIQSATARIISGNIESLPVHTVASPRPSKSTSSRSSKKSDNKNKRGNSRRSSSAKDDRIAATTMSSSKQSKVMLKASDLIKLLTGTSGDMMDPFGTSTMVRGARPAIPIAAMASMATATRVPAPFSLFSPYPMFNPMTSFPMTNFYPGPWFGEKKKKK